MRYLDDTLREVTRDFCGVVSVSRGTTVEFEAAYGLAHRAHRVPVQTDTQFGIASGTKGFTAIVIAALLASGSLTLSSTARSVLGADLPLIDDRVTIEHLLTHTSGIGDYVDEDAETDGDEYVLTVAVHTLADTESYLAALDGFATRFPPGQRFSYCNGSYVVLSLIAERVSGCPFPGLVGEFVFGPADMTSSAFLRSDRLPARAAVGYLDDGRANVLHLPVRGAGDGGAYSTAGDLQLFWDALFAGRLLPPDQVDALVRPRHDVPDEDLRYGRGFWLHRTGRQVSLIGADAGVSFRSTHDPVTGRTHTVLSNTSSGAWPVARRLADILH
ncbi:MAG: serine hydrolase domain-containing protein [Jatrophihabitans sp.]